MLFPWFPKTFEWNFERVFLLSQVLGSHSTVWGMGEDSVFNGQLPEIRDGVVASIGSGSLENLSHTVRT